MKHFSLMLVMVLFTMSTALAQRTITGVVLLEGDGEAIGASVVVEGDEGVGTVTEFDGTFSLDVPETAKALEISYTGYATQVISVDGVSTINVTLAPGELLKEVVVVGYGKQDKEKVTGSVAVVSAKELESVPFPSFDQAIQGRAAGVTVLTNSGQPGSSAEVTIRGNNSITGSSAPLYIMDGVIVTAGDFALLNTNDIESLSILKDASAASIYGSQAAGGVVLITTKKGAEGPAKVTYKAQAGFSVRTQNSKVKFMNSAQLLEYQSIVGTGPGATETQENIDSLSAINTNWDEWIFRPGFMHSHDISISGGSKVNKYFLSASFLDQEGITHNSGYKRGSVRFNDQNQVTDNLSVGLNVIGSFAQNTFAEDEASAYVGNPFFAAQAGLPYQQPYDVDGNYLPLGPFANLNYVEDYNENTDKIDDLKAVVAANLAYKIAKVRGLSLRTSWGIDYSQSNRRAVTPPNTIRGSTTQGGQGRAIQSFAREYRWTGTSTINYDRYFKEKHYLDAVIGNELQQRDFRSLNWVGYGLSDKIPNGAGVAQASAEAPEFLPTIGARHTTNSIASFFARTAYSYDDRYNATVSIRYDGSSRFGKNNQWAPFWSVGLGWVVSNEAFLKGNKNINSLKLVASYGTIGNQGAIGDFQRLANFDNTSYNGDPNAFAPTTLENPDLRWEQSNSVNVGIEYSVLERRLSGEFQFYNNITTDLFVLTNLPYESGFSSVEVNAGKARNRGVEALMRYNIFDKKDFYWSIHANGSYNWNEVLDLGVATEYVPDGAEGVTIIREGEAANSIYVGDYAGVDPATGKPLYFDLDGNIVDSFDPANRKVVGQSTPPFVGGFGTDLTYKGIGLSTFFSFAQGHLMLNNDKYFTQRPGFAGLVNQDVDALNIWQQPGDITAFPSADFDGSFPDLLRSTRFYEDASFIRLRNVQISYTLPSSIAGKVLSGAKIYVQAQNLYTWTGYTGPDPESSSAVSIYNYPPPRVFTFGLDVTF